MAKCGKPLACPDSCSCYGARREPKIMILLTFRIAELTIAIGLKAEIAPDPQELLGIPQPNSWRVRHAIEPFTER